MRTITNILFIFLLATPLYAAKTLDVYFIDVEGGQSTLFVSPSGESMLVDTGWADFNGRDADRIVAAAKQAGVKQIDILVITHYHLDHVGGVPQLAKLIPIRNFIDHGPTVEHGKQPDQLYNDYLAERAKGRHVLARPGEKIPIQGIDAEILTAAGKTITDPLPGAGEANTFCSATKLRDTDPTENAQSVGTLITYGNFRMIDLGDLTWNKEYELNCPMNRIGKVDVYLSTHHGMNLSGSPVIVHALQPKVVVTNNGATKGGSVEALETIRSSPGLEDVWQLHYAEAAGDADNAPDAFIANRKEHGNWIKISAESSGQFTVTNSRNGKTKTYEP